MLTEPLTFKSSFELGNLLAITIKAIAIIVRKTLDKGYLLP